MGKPERFLLPERCRRLEYFAEQAALIALDGVSGQKRHDA
jgi:hypothetical protein